MSTMATYTPPAELAALICEKFGLAAPPPFNAQLHRGSPIRIEFTVTLADGRTAIFSAGRRDHEAVVGYIAEVHDYNDEDFTGWDQYDAIGLSWDQAFYSLVNQFEP